MRKGMLALSTYAAIVALLSAGACIQFEDADPSDPTPTPTASSTPTATPTPTPSPTPVSFVEENFLQGYSSAKVDVLLMIDNSGSMADSQADLMNACADYLDGFVALDLDFHLGVITTDNDDPAHSGKLQGSPSFLDQSTLDPITECEMRILVVGTRGSANEKGLLTSKLALSPPLTNTGMPNEGFLRDNAVLSVLYLSDENDISPGVPMDYANFLVGLKADAGKIHVSSIVGPAGGCGVEGESSAADGERYRLLASSFDGEIVDICSGDFTTALQTISNADAAAATAFPLQHLPIANTIEVTVAGVVTSGGTSTWSYNAASNEIAFAPGAIPAACSNLQISYDLAPGQSVTEPVVNHPGDPVCVP
jgi:hypothetical protein